MKQCCSCMTNITFYVFLITNFLKYCNCIKIAANAMTNALQAAHAAATAQKEREEREAREKFEKERDRLERAAAEPMILPPMPHQSPMHIPSVSDIENVKTIM